MTDPFVGKLAFFRAYSGVLKTGSYVYNSVKGKKERVARILRMHANHREEVDAVFCLEKDYANKADEVPEGGWIPSTAGTYSGKVIITALEANAPNGDNATFTASFEGVGALTKTA
jgi:hypothetical protein